MVEESRHNVQYHCMSMTGGGGQCGGNERAMRGSEGRRSPAGSRGRAPVGVCGRSPQKL